MDDAEPDVLAYMTFPAQHRTKLHSANPIERRNGEIKRRTELVGIFLNEAAITRLVAAPCCSSRTTNGRSSESATCRLGPSPRPAMRLPSASPT